MEALNSVGRLLGLPPFEKMSSAEKAGIVAGVVAAVGAGYLVYRATRTSQAKPEPTAEDYPVPQKGKNEPATPPPSPMEAEFLSARSLDVGSPKGQEILSALEKELANKTFESSSNDNSGQNSMAQSKTGSRENLAEAPEVKAEEETRGTPEESPSERAIDAVDFKSMSVKALRSECMKRGIDIDGLKEKEAIVERLNAFEEESVRELSIDDEAEGEVSGSNPVVMSFLGRKMVQIPVFVLSDTSEKWARDLLGGVELLSSCIEQPDPELKEQALEMIESGLNKASAADDKVGLVNGYRCRGYYKALIRDMEGSCLDYIESHNLIEVLVPSFEKAASYEKTAMIEVTKDAALVASDAKQHELAIKLFKNVEGYLMHPSVRRSGSRTPLGVLSVRSNMADCYIEMKNTAAAEKTVVAVEKEWRKLVEQSRTEKQEAKQDNGDGVGQWQLANAVLRSLWAAAGVEAAAFFSGEGDTKKSESYLENAKQVLFDIFHGKEGLLGEALLQVAVQCVVVLDTPLRAEIVLELALDALRSAHGENSHQYGQALIQLGDLQRKQGRPEEALENVEEAISVLEKIRADVAHGKGDGDLTNDDIQADVANGLSAKARLLTALKRYEEADQVYSDAIVQFEEIGNVNVVLAMAFYAQHLRIVGGRDEQAQQLEEHVRNFEQEHGISVTID